MSTDQALQAPPQTSPCTCVDCPRAATHLLRESSFWIAYGELMKQASNQDLLEFEEVLAKVERADPRALLELMRDIAKKERESRGTGSDLLRQMAGEPHAFSHLLKPDSSV